MASHRIGARLSGLSPEQLLVIIKEQGPSRSQLCAIIEAQAGASDAALRVAEEHAARLVEQPEWVLSEVLLSPDLAPHILAQLPIKAHAVKGTCRAWRRGWKETLKRREKPRLGRVLAHDGLQLGVGGRFEQRQRPLEEGELRAWFLRTSPIPPLGLLTAERVIFQTKAGKSSDMLLPLYNSPKTKVRMSDPTSERIRLIDGTLPLYNATRATSPWPGCLKLLCFGSLALVILFGYVSGTDAESGGCGLRADRRAAQPHDESEAHIDDSIQDKNLSCSLWAAAGECTRNPKYMKDQCARSCAKYMAELRAMPDS
ncbi:hypothetical protein EMIHUDRAFT_239282 [Emiliania huxleyi CCMP1516]|uniref:ShKT domain-containing protein n=4 Tax=Emiliania huxleyi TaxID=2903 RepID=A0A0D3JJL8_EMIH1|nr:hypothetical protein EMIHUDRAFT_239282 [Emiliania huxleyi CCMP1516]EOD23703.1 hypothetical protein EMIHUDRAFT_239282 [Emiliania huxleyi CCMP1516]|eukprot:XP_005776132.1 hypothetical protein EMIHUDRAFT_239282 [Emiliania huxleyi CCMP1516]